MIRFFLIRIVFPLLVLFLVRALFRSILANFRSQTTTAPRTRPQDPPPVVAGGELKKDPVCGTYVSTSGSVTRTVNGQVMYFCSSQCRDKFRVA